MRAHRQPQTETRKTRFPIRTSTGPPTDRRTSPKGAETPAGAQAQAAAALCEICSKRLGGVRSAGTTLSSSSDRSQGGRSGGWREGDLQCAHVHVDDVRTLPSTPVSRLLAAGVACCFPDKGQCVCARTLGPRCLAVQRLVHLSWSDVWFPDAEPAGIDAGFSKKTRTPDSAAPFLDVRREDTLPRGAIGGVYVSVCVRM